MPTDDDKEELEDGSAGGEIRWSPDNVIAPAAASAAQSGAPVSWETLFSDPQKASASQAAPEADNSATAAAAESRPDNLFSRGPAQLPAPKQEQDYNPFTMPDIAPEPSPAQVFHPTQGGQASQPAATSPASLSQTPAPASTPAPSPIPSLIPSPAQTPAPAQNPAAAPAPIPAPIQNSAPAPAQKPAPPQPSQAAAPPAMQQQQHQASAQALGFNPAPHFGSSPDNDAVGGLPGQSKSGQQPVKQYFTAEDIEEEIMRDNGTSAQGGSAQAQGGGHSGQQNAPSPFAQQSSNQGQAAATDVPYGQAPAAPSPYAQPPSSPYAQPSPYGQPSAAPSAYGQDSHSHSSSQSPPVPGTAEGDNLGEGGPDLSSVPEIETARIWEQRSSKEILLGILKAKRAEYAVALFASTDGSVQGEMLIVKSVVIHGAKLVEPDLSGYEAIKVMLAIPHGTYTLLDVTEYVDSAQQLEQGLNVRITPLANALPYLPNSVEELMGASQISRIRSKGPVDLEAEGVQPKPPRQQLSLAERLPSTKMMILGSLTILALVMMIVVLYMRR